MEPISLIINLFFRKSEKKNEFNVQDFSCELTSEIMRMYLFMTFLKYIEYKLYY